MREKIQNFYDKKKQTELTRTRSRTSFIFLSNRQTTMNRA